MNKTVYIVRDNAGIQWIPCESMEAASARLLSIALDYIAHNGGKIIESTDRLVTVLNTPEKVHDLYDRCYTVFVEVLNCYRCG